MSFTASARLRPKMSLTAAYRLSSRSHTPNVPVGLLWPFAAPSAPASLIDQILRVLKSDPTDSMGAESVSSSHAGESAAASTMPQSSGTATSSHSPEDDIDAPRPKGPFAVDDMSMEELVREHADAVYRVALSVTRDPTLAEDASQDALIKAWQALPSFRGDAPLRNWILRITHNTAITLLRKRRDELRDPAELPDTISYRTVESQVQDRMALDRFELALKDLDSLSRSIVVLREVEGLSYDEICDVLDLPMPTVKTRLLRARRQLALALDGWQP